MIATTTTTTSPSEFCSDVAIGAGCGLVDMANVDIDAYDALVERSTLSESGVRMTATTAVRIPAVWQALTMLSGDLAKQPLELWERDGDESKLAERDPAHWRVRHQANEEQTAFKFWRRHFLHAGLWGNGYVYADVRPNGRLAGLYHLLPDRTMPERVDGKLFFFTEFEDELIAFPYTHVIHTEGIVNRECTAGLDPCRALQDAWGLALARMNFASKFFRRGGRVGGVLEINGAVGTKKAKAIETGFRVVYENENEAFKTVAIPGAAKFHEAQHSLGDTQMVESSREGTKDVARSFNMSPSRLGEEGGTSYGTKAEDNRDYLDTTLSPWMQQLVQECERVLLPEQQRKTRSRYFQYDTSSLLQMSMRDRYAAYATAIGSEFMNPNEVRQKLNMNPRPGGDTYGNPAINPQAFERLLVGRVEHAAGVLASRYSRLKKPPEVEWKRRQMAHVTEQLQSSVDVWVAAFGGRSEVICPALAAELVHRLTNHLHGGGTVEQFPAREVVQQSISIGA